MFFTWQPHAVEWFSIWLKNLSHPRIPEEQGQSVMAMDIAAS